MTSTGNNYTVKPVYKALMVLRCLGEEGRDLSLSEVSRLVGLPKTTAFKYLHTLEEAGFVVHRDGTDLYGLGTRVWELGRLVGAELRLREVALPVMMELREMFDETVNLGILDGKEVVYLEMAESRRALMMRARVGGRDPVYSTSLGKAILAFLPEDRWNSHLPTRLTPRTDRTQTSLKALKADLLEVRERGYGLDHGENEEGARCIGAPIFNQDGRVAGAISLAAPESRLTDDAEPEVASEVIRAANEISERLGYRATSEDEKSRTYSLK